MSSRIRRRSGSTSLLVIVLCGGLAFALSLFFRDRALKPAAPAIFLLVVILVAHFFGRLASLLVTVAGSLVFAAFLFEPYGSLAMCNATDRIILSLFALCAIVAVLLSKKPDID